MSPLYSALFTLITFLLDFLLPHEGRAPQEEDAGATIIIKRARMAPTMSPINKANLGCKPYYTCCYKMLDSPFHLLPVHLILPVTAILGMQRPTAENIQTGSYRGTVEPSGPLT